MRRHPCASVRSPPPTSHCDLSPIAALRPTPLPILGIGSSPCVGLLDAGTSTVASSSSDSALVRRLHIVSGAIIRTRGVVLPPARRFMIGRYPAARARVKPEDVRPAI